MTTLRLLLCLALLIGNALPVLSRVIPQDSQLIPLARRALPTADLRGGRGPFDEHLNIRVNSDNSGELQNEEQACISPLDPDIMVAVWRDFRLGYRRVGVGYSHDNGLTWDDGLFPQMYYPWQSDPLLVVDADGNFAAMVISYDPSQGGEDGLLQVTSFDGGTTWNDSVWAAHATVPVGFEDKEMLAVDVSGSPYHGTYYCAWTHFYGEGNFDSTDVWFVYKRPGLPYSQPIVFGDTTNTQWTNVAIGADGEVYVSWLDYDYDAIMFSRSLDGAETWTSPEVIREMTFISALLDPDLLIFSYGALAADLSTGPHRGRLYMVYTDANALGTETDVWLVYSDNNGDSWSTPVELDDEPENIPYDQFHPWITVDSEGRDWVAFYDSRNDPNNILMDLYFTVSEDGGTTWRENERITTVSSDPGAGSLDAGLIGEYVGWFANYGKALAVWTDTRLGNQDVYSSIIDSIFAPDAAEEDVLLQPSSLILSAYPNPTNGAATIAYSLSAASNVRLALYNVAGQLVREVNVGNRPAGAHHYNLNLDGMATGIYFAKLKAANESVRTKLLLLR